MLGEIPGGNLRLYLKCENANDSSGNGFNLTNHNTVTFTAGKFSNGANFGTTGTNKGLSYNANILSGSNPSDVCVFISFKFLDTSNHSGTIIVISTDNTAQTNRLQFSASYSISGGTVTLTGTIAGSPSNQSCSITFSADTNWHFLRILIIAKTINIDMDRNNNAGSAAVTTQVSTAATYFNMVGSNRGLNSPIKGMVDEVIVSESLYTGTQIRDRIKYYTHYKGLMGPQMI